MVLPGSQDENPRFLYHFSEDPQIKLFEPRGGGRTIKGRPEGEKLVWAIDEHHSPMYLFPRDCPRIILWAYEDSDPADIERWIGGANPVTVAHIEAAWLARLQTCRLFKYTFDATGFESIHDHGTHVSRAPTEPMSVEPVGKLEAALRSAKVELRVMDSLQPLAEAWRSSLHFSGIRLRNAVGWTAPA